jgi:uncharacterized membrane-anchored protein
VRSVTSRLRRLFPEPAAAKVPEVTAVFWVLKLLTTAGGEALSDYLAFSGGSKVVGGAVELAFLAAALWLQFRARRYVAQVYWLLALAIGTSGTGIADTMHVVLGLPYALTTVFWAVVLAAVFTVWHRYEHTLSIHSIVTTRREAFYWATVMATFALGTAIGDFTATSLHLGFAGSIVLFAVVILLPAIAWGWFRLNEIVAFWAAYVVTRPLGASVADYVSKPHSLSGANFGDLPTALVLIGALAVLVVYVAVTRSDIQPPHAALAD